VVADCAAPWRAGAAAGFAGILLFYYRLSSFAYLGHLSANLKLAFQPGRDADPSPLNEYSASFLNLQAFLSRLIANPHVSNGITYAVCFAIAGLMAFACWRKKNLAARPYTILALLVMLELLVSYHRFYDHVFMLAALPASLLANEADVVTISILHTTDLHGHILPTVDYQGRADLGGLARCATQIRQWQRANPNSVLIDVGDVYQGTEIGLQSRGAAIQRSTPAARSSHRVSSTSTLTMTRRRFGIRC